MHVSRRRFLGGAGVLAAGAALPLSFVFSRTARAASFGPLVADPAGILDLPAGFSYAILERSGGTMTDGYRVPGAPDGMACFAGPSGTLVLMRNHELGANVANGPYPIGQAPTQAYDASAMGGVTRLVVSATTFARVSSNLVLTGTIRNCAGGPSPWGWLTCEETFGEAHGYVFLCDVTSASVAPAQKLACYGRFNHEAATIDPATNICYLTEDRGDSCLYRFVPTHAASPFVGKLQAMKVVGESAFDTSSGMTIGAPRDVEWVDIDEPDPATDTVRAEARSKGAATVVRGEGIWYHGGAVYICSTSGGPAEGGQIFRLTPGATLAGGRLELLAQSTGKSHLDSPDNITVAPWGDVYMAEDGGGEQLLRFLDVAGNVHDFARNALSDGELAGVCFSPDGRALFVNLQSDGITLVVTGPFPATTPADAGADGAAPQDGGSANAPRDASTGHDAAGEDASDPPKDGGASSDGGYAVDSGARHDAGASADGGDVSPGGESGCNAGGRRGGFGALLATLATMAGVRALREPGAR